MSQSCLRKVRRGEEVYVELQDDGGFNVAYAIGTSEREASDMAERRWRHTFGTEVARRPTRKTVVVRKARAMYANPTGEPIMR